MINVEAAAETNLTPFYHQTIMIYAEAIAEASLFRLSDVDRTLIVLAYVPSSHFLEDAGAKRYPA